MDEVSLTGSSSEGISRSVSLDGARRMALKHIEEFVLTFSNHQTFSAAAASSASASLAQEAESARIQEAGHLRCSGAEIERFVAMLRNSSSILRACAAFALLQGIVEEAKADSFNMPVYLPSIEELRGVIEKEGSFHVDQLEIIELNWDPNHDDDNPNCVPDVMTSGNNIAKCIRAISESMLANHFGAAILEDLFERLAAKIAEHLSKEKNKYSNLVISMIKKDEDRLVASF